MRHLTLTLTLQSGGATLEFDVELLGFAPKKKERWQLSKEEQHAEANKIKDEGTALFKEKMFSEAMAKYEEAQEFVEHDEAMVALWVTCKLNAAQVIQSTHTSLSLSHCTFSDTLGTWWIHSDTF